MLVNFDHVIHFLRLGKIVFGHGQFLLEMNLPRYYGKHKPACAICCQKGMLLCCDYCPLAYHPECLSPPLKCQPSGYWACPQCQYHLNTLETQTKTPPISPITISLQAGPAFQLKSSRSRNDSGKTRSHIFTSGYRGVYSRAGKWNAQIQYNGKKVYLGSYSSEEEAAHAYDIAAKRYHGSKAILNFHMEDGTSCRNPFQVNSKPTSRRNSVLSALNDVSELNRETSAPHSRVQSVNTELPSCDLFFVSLLRRLTYYIC